MSTHPRIESRVSALEHRQLSLETHTEDLIEKLTNDLMAEMKHLYDDMVASFKQMGTYVVAIEDRFEKIEDRLDKIETTMTTKNDFFKIEDRLNKIETMMVTKDDLATMATKGDLAALETRILNAFNQLLTSTNR